MCDVVMSFGALLYAASLVFVSDNLVVSMLARDSCGKFWARREVLERAAPSVALLFVGQHNTKQHQRQRQY